MWYCVVDYQIGSMIGRRVRNMQGCSRRANASNDITGRLVYVQVYNEDTDS